MTPRSLLAPARLAGQPILRSQSDGRLVDLVRAGYDPAFEAIVARYRKALLRYAGRLLDDERAEDVVQQTFVKAYDAMVGGTAELQLRPWLYRIAHNTALNALRDRGLRHEELDETIDGVERPDQAYERRQGLRDVVASVNELPPRQRDALVLQALEGRSYEEIARELGVSDGSVRQLLNRARTQLRAGVTALTPVGLLTRIPWEASSGPVAEAGAGALVAKVAATVVVSGAVAGGVASVEHPSTSSARDEPTTQSPDRDRARGGDSVRGSSGSASTEDAAVETQDRPRDDRDRDDRSGPGGGGDEDDDRSGPGGGGADDENSGPGDGAEGDEDNSGPGGGGSSGPGGGGQTTTPAPVEDNSGSGSGSSGSGSGSGSASSGSGSSGSGSSGSG